MTSSSAPRRGVRLRAVSALSAGIGLAAGLLGLALVPAGAASASLGSVPAEVTAYVTSGAMVARLNDVYGPNAAGTAGIKFDDTTKEGPISRVYEWTADRLANKATDHPVQLTNNWVVPITIGGTSVGLATIWINPQTVDAELAEFTSSAALGTALTTVPATAALVRDTTTNAWLALDGGKVAPLVAGKSGLTEPVPVESLKLSPTAPAPPPTTEPNTGLALAIGVVGLIVIIIVVALLLPRGRREKKRDSPATAEPATAEPATVQPATPKPATPKLAATKPAATKPAVTKPATTKPGPTKPATLKPATPKPATPKPAGPRPSGRTPTTSPAAKPASSKPPVSRSAASKPPASKPPAPKQPPRPRASKPPSDSGSDSSD
ncbi:MAG: hypothetical protein ABIS08_00215 [Pseudolysinimonas sp.]